MFFDSCGQKESALSLRKHRCFRKSKKNHCGKLEFSQQRIQRDYCMQFFFFNGKIFCLRGGEEHCQLKLSELKKFTYPLRYMHTENSSKNRSGGLAQIRVKNKVVPISAVPDAGSRCHVYVLDLYIQKLPPEAFSRDNFYVQPCLIVPDDPSKPWFTTNPIGKNTLS